MNQIVKGVFIGSENWHWVCFNGALSMGGTGTFRGIISQVETKPELGIGG